MPRPQISYQKQFEGQQRQAMRALYADDVRKATEKLLSVAEYGDCTIRDAAEAVKLSIKAEADYLKHEQTMRKQRKALKKDKNYT